MPVEEPARLPSLRRRRLPSSARLALGRRSHHRAFRPVHDCGPASSDHQPHRGSVRALADLWAGSALGLAGLAGLAALAIILREIWGLDPPQPHRAYPDDAAHALNHDDDAAAKRAVVSPADRSMPAAAMPPGSRGRQGACRRHHGRCRPHAPRRSRPRLAVRRRGAPHHRARKPAGDAAHRGDAGRRARHPVRRRAEPAHAARDRDPLWRQAVGARDVQARPHGDRPSRRHRRPRACPTASSSM